MNFSLPRYKFARLLFPWHSKRGRLERERAREKGREREPGYYFSFGREKSFYISLPPRADSPSLFFARFYKLLLLSLYLLPGIPRKLNDNGLREFTSI
jgi:hypothetical protein